MSKKEMFEDLKRSGLTTADVKKLKLKPLTPAETRMLTGFEAKAYQIVYHDPKGKATDFYRIRFLEDVRYFGQEKTTRYVQPPGTLPRLYFSPLQNWSALLEDTRKPLWITEGEKKASRACKAGQPTLGLGGVWSWRALKQGILLIEDFDLIEWDGREVTLCFDSDAATNPGVLGALNSLARQLDEAGAIVYLLVLPESEPGVKTGLDDLLQFAGDKVLDDLEPEAFQEQAELWALNEELALIRESGSVYELASDQLRNKTTLVDVLYAHRRFLKINAAGEPKEVNSAAEWLRWSRRREHSRLDYVPGGAATLPDGTLNLWKGWGVEPVEGTVKPFLDLLKYIFGNDDAGRQWFLRWLACPLQKPGTKLYTSVLLFSLQQGTGKSLLGMTIGRIYGDNFTIVSQEELAADFNAWAKNKQFALGEEITGSDSRRAADKLKHLITRETVTINAKYQPTYVLPDRLNYLLTSNHPDALYLEQHDRRFFIHEIEAPPLAQKFYDAYDKWYRGDGPAHLFHYLLHEVDLKGFNPRAPAPLTGAKEDMVMLSRSDLDLFARQLRDDPESVLRIGMTVSKRELWTIDELLVVADPDGQKRTTKIALSKALRRAGFRQLPITKTATGSKRLWATRSQDAWIKASPAERAHHYDDSGERDRRMAGKAGDPKY